MLVGVGFGSVVGVLEMAVVVVVVVVVEESAETIVGNGVSPAEGERVNQLSGKVRSMSLRKVSQASEAEPLFPEIDDAS